MPNVHEDTDPSRFVNGELERPGERKISLPRWIGVFVAPSFKYIRCMESAVRSRFTKLRVAVDPWRAVEEKGGGGAKNESDLVRGNVDRPRPGVLAMLSVSNRSSTEPSFDSVMLLASNAPR